LIILINTVINIKSMEQFIQNTIDPALFDIGDVENDNACFYRAIANYVYFAVPHEEMRNIKRFHSWGKTKPTETVHTKMGRYSLLQDELARFIQKKIVEYIEQHSAEIIPQTGMTIEQSIELIHELSLGEYLSYYEVFAGDVDINQDLENEAFYIDRWGSIVEQYVISKLIKCPVIVYNTQKYDTKFQKIINGKVIRNKPEKGVRLKLSAVIGEEFMKDRIPIVIIWREYNNNGHYLVSYPKDPSKIVQNLRL
jgi:hypothetical protein